jgi:phytoene dehydrogenase-like protein
VSADAIIVGGGHNGLVAACYPAPGGRDVLLLEAHGLYLTGGATFPGAGVWGASGRAGHTS